LYTIQEVVLSHYCASLPQSRVLEFGVGFGRHIEYLNKLPNIEVHGVDQSPTMLESLKSRLVNEDDLIKRMILIEPRQKLPFPDNYFDVVYTVSVLIHIQPEHMQEILKELIRVAKHRIIHFENNITNDEFLTAPDHNGCWAHPIVKHYRTLGYDVDLLEKVMINQDVYVVNISDDPNYDFKMSPVTMKRLSQIDKRILPHMQFLEGEVGWMKAELAQRQEKEHLLQLEKQQLELSNSQLEAEKQQLELSNSQLEAEKQQLELSNSQLEAEKQQLELNKMQLESIVRQYEGMLHEIYSSFAWKVINRLRQSKLLYALSKPVVYMVKKKQQVVPALTDTENLTFFRKQIEEKELSSVVAIHHPDWLGVSNSTKDLFKHTLELREVYSAEEAEKIAELLYDSQVKTIIFSGFASGYAWVIRSLKKLNPQVKILVFWHGNTTHMYEDYSWFRHQEIIDMCREGIIDTWGFAKKSTADLYANLGIKTAFVMNRISPRKHDWSVADNKIIKIGLYASGTTWNKNAYTQIAAASLIKNAEVFAIPCNERMEQFARQLEVNMKGKQSSVSRDELLKSLGENSINFYVTFTECAPLIPLESLSLGVPCLTGPNHHYFSGSPLEDYLVVRSPDDPMEIAKKAVRALKNKEIILDLYLEWVKEYNQIAEQSVVDFIEG